jgi:predicted secreted protein
MSKQAAFGSSFSVGTRQVESMTVTGAADAGGGDLTVTVTATGIAGVAVAVNVAALDSPTTVATKVRTAMNLLATITDYAIVGGTGPTFSLTMLLPADNNAAMAIVFDAGTSGCTAGASTDTTAGVATATVASVRGISGPGLSLDTIDVTTHDSTSAWEQVVAGVLREGEVSLDLAYDPAENTQDGTATSGLLYVLKNKSLRHFTLTFPDTTVWTFPGYVSGFDQNAAHDGALAASATIKISGAPVLA